MMTDAARPETAAGNVEECNSDSVRRETEAPKLINFDVTDIPRRDGDTRPL